LNSVKNSNNFYKTATEKHPILTCFSLSLSLSLFSSLFSLLLHLCFFLLFLPPGRRVRNLVIEKY
jgi:hypothetical protein